MNRPFDQEILNPRERPVVTDMNLAYSDMLLTLRYVMSKLLANRSVPDILGAPMDGFLGDGFLVRPTSPASGAVRIAPGLGMFSRLSETQVAINSVQGLNDLSPFKPAILLEEAQIVLDAQPAAGNQRIDIIEVKPDFTLGDPSARLKFDAGIGDFIPGGNVNKTLSWALDGRIGRNATLPINYKAGTEAATGTAVPPPPSAGYYRIAEITVKNATDNPSGTITESDVIDWRTLSGRNRVVCVFDMPSVKNAGQARPRIVSLECPPGVVLAVHGLDQSQAQVQVYLKTGEIAQTIHPHVTVTNGQRSLALSPYNVVPILNELESTVVDSTIASNLVGGFSMVPVQLALRQPVWYFGLKAAGLATDAADNDAVKWRDSAPNFPTTIRYYLTIDFSSIG